MNLRIVLYILLLISSFGLIRAQGESILWLNATDSLYAGSSYDFEFNEIDTSAFMVVKNAFGISVLSAKSNGEKTSFSLPSPYNLKAGTLGWDLVLGGTKLKQGSIKILPKITTHPINETYLGPRQIFAGKTDYSMLVSLPTDSLDNLLPHHTPVQLRTQRHGKADSMLLFTDHGFAWKRINTQSKTGKIFLGVSCYETSSKEMVVDVYPNTPVAFEIFVESEHQIADGNQTTRIYTSQIKDTFGNIIADGTLVKFDIQNQKGVHFFANGQSINGVVTTQILQPEEPDTWTLFAYIEGMARSNTLTQKYTSALSYFPVAWDAEPGKLQVGPLLSYMQQFIPDGTKVEFKLFYRGQIINQFIQYSNHGSADILLHEFSAGSPVDSVTIRTMGETKTLEIPYHE